MVDGRTLDLEVRGRKIREMIEAARAAGGTVIPEGSGYRVHVAAAVTQQGSERMHDADVLIQKLKTL